MQFDNSLRKMARSSYWQRIYRASKNIGSISLFENTCNLSGIQNLFLHWLETYDILYSELYSKEWDILTEDMIEDDIRCDAFLYWRHRQQQKMLYENKKESSNSDKKSIKQNKKNQKNFPIFSGTKK